MHLPRGQSTCQPIYSLEHECKANRDCKDEKGIFTICKDLDGKRMCSHPDQCLSNCQPSEFCGSEHECKQVPGCTSDEDCEHDLVCKLSSNGLRACQPKPSTEPEPSKVHECGRSSECKAKDKLGMICKEEENMVRKCVRPSECLRRRRCLGTELCDAENECRAPLECSSIKKCPPGQTCQEHKPGDPKTCHPDPNVEVPANLEKCDTTKDCTKAGDAERVCKEIEKGKKVCVAADQCESQCESNEICDSEGSCKALRTCTANFDCKEHEVCKKHKGKKLYTCQSKTEEDFQELNECGSNKDCELLGNLRTVCKEERGKKICVAPEQCWAMCFKRELCGPDHKCETAQHCVSSKVCKTEEKCRVLAPGGLATCQPSPPEPHQCGWSKDCELLGGENTLCKEAGGVRRCVCSD